MLFRGAGERALASGADIAEFGETRSSRDTAVAAYHLVGDTMSLIERLPQPTLALIHGYYVLTADFTGGIRAVREKRQPQFTGR